MTKELRIAEFGWPGPLRDRLVGAILSGEKTSTSSLLIEYSIGDSEPLPVVGALNLVVDSTETGVAVIKTTDIRVARFGEVDWPHARDEGEGFASVAEWAAADREFWESQTVLESIGDPTFAVTDEIEVVLERFTVVKRLEATP